MKVEITYATLCSATVILKDDTSWTYNQPFKTLKEAIEWAEAQIEEHLNFINISHIYITDDSTAEVLAECFPDEDEPDDYDDWGYNEDMGFDPYMGCYSDDC